MSSFEEQVQENHLTCPICQQFYSNPKALPCLHSFCEGCLRDFVFSRNYDTVGRFPCPICQQETALPVDGVKGYPGNHLLNSLLDTLQKNGNLSGRPGYRQNGRNGASSLGQESRVQPSAPLRELSNISTMSNRTRSADNNTLQGNESCQESLNLMHLSRFSRSLGLPVQRNYHNSLLRFGKYGTGIVDFTKPIGMCISGKNSIPLIHVTDNRDNRVMTFSMDGQVQSVFTCSGDIYDLTSDKKDLLYVVNSKADRALACCYTQNGQRKAAFGNLFTYESPHGICVNRLGNVVVSCPDSNRCYIMDTSGKMLNHFGKKGKGNDSFLKPLYMTTNSNNNILVSDYDSNCVKVFDKMGNPKFAVGEFGCNNGELHQPLGIVCDQYDNIIVADSGNDRIQIFHPDGKFKRMFLKEINMQGFLLGAEVVPRALALVRDKLVVLYTGENLAEIRVYRYSAQDSGSKSCACM